MNLINKIFRQVHITAPEGKLIQPSYPYQSELLLRINQRGLRQMPPLDTKIVDPIGHEIIERWIMEMSKEPPTDE